MNSKEPHAFPQYYRCKNWRPNESIARFQETSPDCQPSRCACILSGSASPLLTPSHAGRLGWWSASLRVSSHFAQRHFLCSVVISSSPI